MKTRFDVEQTRDTDLEPAGRVSVYGQRQVEVVALLEVSLEERPIGENVSPGWPVGGLGLFVPTRKPRNRVYFVARRVARFGAGEFPGSSETLE